MTPASILCICEAAGAPSSVSSLHCAEAFTMPTAMELDLFQGGDAGTGSIHKEAMLARSLGNIVDVPEQQVRSFIRTRDRSSVKKLQRVLEEISQNSERSLSSPSSKSGRASSADPLSPLLDRRKRTQARLQSMGSLRTSYSDFHGSREPKRKTPPVAIDGIIRKEYQKEIDQWQECASENQIQTLADICRNLRPLNKDEKPSSFPVHKSQPPAEKDNSRNMSVGVPMGSIYKQTEKEALTARRIMQAHEQDLLAATRIQESWQNGSRVQTAPASFRTTAYGQTPTSKIQESMLETPHATLKSWNKESWHGGMHRKSETKRHDHRMIARGETDWNNCGLTGHTISDAIFALTNPKQFPGGGKPNRSRLVQGKMARFEAENARLKVAASASVPSLS